MSFIILSNSTTPTKPHGKQMNRLRLRKLKVLFTRFLSRTSWPSPMSTKSWTRRIFRTFWEPSHPHQNNQLLPWLLRAEENNRGKKVSLAQTDYPGEAIPLSPSRTQHGHVICCSFWTTSNFSLFLPPSESGSTICKNADAIALLIKSSDGLYGINVDNISHLTKNPIHPRLRQRTATPPE